MKTILVLVIYLRAVSAAEFDDAEACQRAANQITQWYKYGSLAAFCFPKSSGR